MMSLPHKAGGITVTRRTLGTRRRTYDLSRIESVTIGAPLLLAGAVSAIGGIGIVLGVGEYLFAHEKVTVLATSVIGLVVTSLFGTLKVQSLALRGGDQGIIYGPIWHLFTAKVAVDQIIAARPEHQGDRP